MTMKFYQVFRKDWDTIKTHCARGGDVLFAVRRRLRCTSVSPANDDSLPDQMYVSLSGSLKTIFLMISSSYTTLMWTTSLIFVSIWMITSTSAFWLTNICHGWCRRMGICLM